MQCDAWAPVWERIRDHAKPVEPHDVWDLRAVRDMGEPLSLKKRKRIALKSKRPEVTPARPAPPKDTSAREYVLEATRLGLVVAKLVAPNKHAPARPVERPTGRDRGVAVPHDREALDQRRAQRRAEAARIAAYGSDELSRAWRIWREA